MRQPKVSIVKTRSKPEYPEIREAVAKVLSMIEEIGRRSSECMLMRAWIRSMHEIP